MPKLRFSLDLNYVNIQFFIICDQKPKFRGHAEVRDCEVRYFFQNTIAAEFNIDLLFTVKVVADVKEVQPLWLVEVSKECFHVDSHVLKAVSWLTAKVRTVTVRFFLSTHHLWADCFNNGVHTEGGTLEHWDVVVVIDQLLVGVVREVFGLLLLMDELLFTFCLNSILCLSKSWYLSHFYQ